nr:MAG TPA: hypothetical protein [Caudoviricetes sp.]
MPAPFPKGGHGAQTRRTKDNQAEKRTPRPDARSPRPPTLRLPIPRHR